ncbi:hypothetical protein BY458DRAFT_75646 [Sporodiniella umbellata]|nr:hypothetical protein BY458DRAFT_75646 [Sporodiniella umbellata]
MYKSYCLDSLNHCSIKIANKWCHYYTYCAHHKGSGLIFAVTVWNRYVHLTFFFYTTKVTADCISSIYQTALIHA